VSDPLLSLVPAVRRALGAAFGPEYASTDPAIRPSNHADYQSNVALGLRARLGRPPREIADAILAHLDDGMIEQAEVAGPGFINLVLRNGFLSTEIRAVAKDERLGLALAEHRETVVVDYSSPNLAKEMHVGHLRSTIIGDALVRVLEALGHRVIRQNHLGDWGTPFGMLIEELRDSGHGAVGSSMTELGAFYRAARKHFDEDPGFAERSRRRVVLLQSGDPETLALWRELVDVTLRHAESLYQKLGVTLRTQDVAGESFYNPMLKDVIAALDRHGLLERSDGALCVFPPGFTGRDGARVPLIVEKQDGGHGYATTDLAALRHRIETLRAQRILVVVGAPQAQHFAMLFATAKLAGWLGPPVRAEHVAFGSVLGADCKMFKTRAGEAVRLHDLLDEAIERARAVVAEKNPDLPSEDRERVARAVGIGAVKYADLSSDRVKDYVFDYARMLAFEGNTAPYLQYAHARIRSIFRRGGVIPPDPSVIEIGERAERSLALALLRFPTVVQSVSDALEPHQLCTYLFELATTFSTFYEECPVLKAASEGERASRLALADTTARVLATGLGQLGIEAPDRM
jgi:arginyl-tRNA synthetase